VLYELLYACDPAYLRWQILVVFGLQVRDFNIAKSDKDIGFYAGFLGERIQIPQY
jgi:hypothetical protein